MLEKESLIKNLWQFFSSLPVYNVVQNFAEYVISGI